MVYLPVTLLSTLLLTLTCGESAFARPRIVGGFALYVVCTLLAPLMGNLWGLLALVAAAGVADAASQGALFGLAGENDMSSLSDENVYRSSKINTQSLVSGTSISGIVTSMVNILTRALVRDHGIRTVCYFWTVAAFCGICVVVCVAKLPIGDDRFLNRSHLSSSSPTGSSSSPSPRVEPLQVEHLTRAKPLLTKIIKKARAPLVALTSIYWVTITIFPGVLQENVHDAADGGWVAPIATFVFNICDAVGKILPPLPIVSDAVLLAIAGSRALFVPVCLASVHAHPALICFLMGALVRKSESPTVIPPLPSQSPIVLARFTRD